MKPRHEKKYLIQFLVNGYFICMHYFLGHQNITKIAISLKPNMTLGNILDYSNISGPDRRNEPCGTPIPDKYTHIIHSACWSNNIDFNKNVIIFILNFFLF